MTTPYSRLDRALHYAAFSALPAQMAMADMERVLFGRRYADIPIRKPVFVTALARAGTTVLLSVLSEMSDFATHTYRDMPFILTPMLWSRLSSPFRKVTTAKERAHGDGLTIDYDSPEAFEEIVWKAHWPEHYQGDRIIPWDGAEEDEDFSAFLRDHMRKIIALHTPPDIDSNSIRYLSKNNANIARLEMLARTFPDGHILIPVRHPWHHAESLRHQHEHFSSLHTSDIFSRRYMEWLGHYEFGAALKPINFNNWMAGSTQLDPVKPGFWLAYWHAAYSAVLEAVRDTGLNSKTMILIDYDGLCHTPAPILPLLADRLDLHDPAQLLARSDRFRPARTYEFDKSVTDTPLYKSCEELYASLLEYCLTTE